MNYEVMIRRDILESLRAYAESGRPTGGFLRAVLANDLMEAAGRADEDNLIGLTAICSYVYNEMPGDCHGSCAMVDAWIERHRVERMRADDPKESKP